MTEPDPDRFRVLHVCTGNICRSPMAEQMMRAGLAARLGDRADAFDIASAGTMGFTGSPMEAYALTSLSGYDVDGSGFRARELVSSLVVAADLVLAATREHRAAAVVMHPRGAARTFTLREFDRLCSAVDPAVLVGGTLAERARALVKAAAANRGLVPPATPRDDDVEDPYQGPESAFQSCAALVHASLQRPLDLLTGSPG